MGNLKKKNPLAIKAIDHRAHARFRHQSIQGCFLPVMATTLATLPTPVLSDVATFLDPPSLAPFRLVSRSLNDAATHLYRRAHFTTRRTDLSQTSLSHLSRCAEHDDISRYIHNLHIHPSGDYSIFGSGFKWQRDPSSGRLLNPRPQDELLPWLQPVLSRCRISGMTLTKTEMLEDDGHHEGQMTASDVVGFLFHLISCGLLPHLSSLDLDFGRGCHGTGWLYPRRAGMISDDENAATDWRRHWGTIKALKLDVTECEDTVQLFSEIVEVCTGVQRLMLRLGYEKEDGLLHRSLRLEDGKRLCGLSSLDLSTIMLTENDLKDILGRSPGTLKRLVLEHLILIARGPSGALEEHERDTDHKEAVNPKLAQSLRTLQVLEDLSMKFIRRCCTRQRHLVSERLVFADFSNLSETDYQNENLDFVLSTRKLKGQTRIHGIACQGKEQVASMLETLQHSAVFVS